MTERLLSYIERESMKMQPFSRVAAETGVSAPTVYNVFTALAMRLEETFRPARQFPRQIGVDKHFEQMELFWDLPYQGEQGRPSAAIP